jgi:hypothetical protein
MTVRRSRPRVAGAWLVLAVAAAGCGGDGRPPVYPVTGQVLVKGKPADGAFLVFHPADGGGPDAHRPYATTDETGTFRLTTFDSGDGAPAGKYRVTVVWRPKPKSTIEAEGPDRLAGRYADARTTKLEATVGQAATTLEPLKID